MTFSFHFLDFDALILLSTTHYGALRRAALPIVLLTSLQVLSPAQYPFYIDATQGSSFKVRDTDETIHKMSPCGSL
jgi:hypothetical protein